MTGSSPWRRWSTLAALVLFLLLPVHIAAAQGLPFQSTVDHASWHYNTNGNGVQDFGEWLIDCGGTANVPCNITPSLITVVVQQSRSGTYYSPGLGKTFRVIEEEGTLNGIGYTIVYPDPVAHPNLRTDLGVVVSFPTRAGSIYTPDNSPPLPFKNEWITQGAVLGIMSGSLGSQPIVHATEQAILMGIYMRQILGKSIVVSAGGSFGGVAASLSALLRPDVFSAFESAGAPSSLPLFVNWHRILAWLEIGRSNIQLFGSRNVGGDGIFSQMHQYGLTVHNYDVARHADTWRVPGRFIHGQTDPHWPGDGEIQRIQQSLTQAGIDWIELIEEPNAGHGEPPLTGLVQYQGVRDFLDRIDTTLPRLPLGIAPAAAPPAVELKYADLIGQSRLRGELRGPSGLLQEVWSMGGIGANAGTLLDTNAIVQGVGPGTGSLYTTSFEGVVRRWDLDSGALTEGASRVLGIDPQSLTVSPLWGQGFPFVLVGDVQGLHVMDPDLNLVRMSTHGRDVRAIVVGDILTSNPGYEVAYANDTTYLNIEDALTGTLLFRSTIGQVSKLEVVPGAPGYNADLMASLYRGMIVRLEVDDAVSPQALTATMISEYTETQLRDFHIVASSAGDRIVTGGLLTNQDAGGPFLFVLDMTGSIVLQIPISPAAAIEHIHPMGGDEVLVGGPGGAARYDIVTGAVTPVSFSGTNFAVGDMNGDGNDDIATISRNRIQLLDHQETPITQIDGTSLSNVSDVWFNAGQARWELSVLLPTSGASWSIRVFELATGNQVATVSLPKLSVDHRKPRKIVRKADAYAGTSYEYFDHAGDWIDLMGIGFRFSRNAGFPIIADTREREHDFLLANAPEAINGPYAFLTSAGYEIGQTGLATTFGATGLAFAFPQISSRVLGSIDEGVVTSLDITGPQSHVAVGGPAGNIDLFELCLTCLTPVAEVDGLGMGITGISLGDLEGDGIDELVATSWLRDGAGHSLYTLDTSLNVMRRVDAGYVTGSRIIDLDPTDSVQEIVVGEQDGHLTIYDHNLDVLYRRHDGDMSTGDLESLKFVPADPTNGLPNPILVVGHSSGFRVFEVQ